MRAPRIDRALTLLGAAALLGLYGCSETNLSSIPDPATVVEDPPATEEIPPPTEDVPPTEVVPEDPIADAGPSLTVQTGENVVLDGTGSYDPLDLDPLEYQWTLLSWPNGSSVQVQGLDTVAPSFIADVGGDYAFELTVENTAGLWDLTPDTVVITAESDPAGEPIADAGPDQSVAPLEVITLDGTASFDPAGLMPLTYEWSLVSSPAGSTTQVVNAAATSPTVFIDLAGTYEFDLTVMNNAGVWDSTPDRVAIEALPDDGFYVEVSWNTNADIDLHVLDTGAAFYSAGDASWCNPNPSWGAAGTADDPSLDWDVTTGFGPETTTIDSPADGTYGIVVHYYGSVGGDPSCGFFGCPNTVATVTVYLAGQVVQTFSRQMNTSGEVWNVANVDFPASTVTGVDTTTTSPVFNCQ